MIFEGEDGFSGQNGGQNVLGKKLEILPP